MMLLVAIFLAVSSTNFADGQLTDWSNVKELGENWYQEYLELKNRTDPYQPYPSPPNQQYPDRPNQQYPDRPNQQYPDRPNQPYPDPPNQQYPAPPNQHYPTPHPNPVPPAVDHLPPSNPGQGHYPTPPSNSPGNPIRPPNVNQECPNDVVHDTFNGLGYFFSWEDPRSSQLVLNWPQAINFCKARCLQLVSIDIPQEHEFLSRHIVRGGVRGVWTSGRKCDFRGCETQKHLQPVDVFGWFWESVRKQLPPTTNRFDGFWSNSGALGKPQPDDQEGHRGGPHESCLAILNNAYGDGIAWHDEVCSKRNAFICQQPKKVPNYDSIEPYGFSYEKTLKNN